MEFEEWWEQNWSEFPQLHFAREAWDAATAAERQRCREIVKALCGTVVGEMTVKRIADEIGE